MIYAVAEFGTTLVKIGTTRDLGHRLSGLRQDVAGPIYVLGTWPGGRKVERSLHETFRSLRRHGEWFEFAGRDPAAEIGAAIDPELSAASRARVSRDVCAAFGADLRGLRVAAGVSQTAIGIRQATVSDRLTGQVKSSPVLDLGVCGLL